MRGKIIIDSIKKNYPNMTCIRLKDNNIVNTTDNNDATSSTISNYVLYEFLLFAIIVFIEY